MIPEALGRLLPRLCTLGLCVGALFGASVGCNAPDGGSDPEPAAVVGSFDDFFVVADSVLLFEDANTINVAINVQIDPLGGLLIADEGEHRVRRYSEDGSLLWQVGRRGGGPGEFTSPVSLSRLSDSTLVTVERNGRVQVWGDSNAPELLDGFSLDVRMVSGAWPLGGTSLLVAGSFPEDPMGNRLHVRALESPPGPSFFRPFDHTTNREISGVAGWSHASVKGPALAVVFATIDSVFLFDGDGTSRGSIPLRIPGFRRVEGENPSRTLSPRERAEWLSRFDYVSDVHWLNDDLLLVGFQSLVPEEALGRRRHLAGVTTSGELRFVYRDGPRLLAVDRDRSLIYFQSESFERPNEVLLARLGNAYH